METCSLVRQVHISACFLGKTDVGFYCAEDERKGHPDCYQRKVQKPASMMVWGCISAHGMGDLHISEGTIDAEAYVGILGRHMLLSRRRLFPGSPCLFQQDNARPHSAQVTTAWLHRGPVLDWPACGPDLFPLENVCHIIKRRIRQRQPQIVEQLKSCIDQEWTKIPLAKLKQLITSVPKRLQSVIKRKGDVSLW